MAAMYRYIRDGTMLRVANAEGVILPLAGPLWAAFERWLAEGNTPALPAPEVVLPDPDSVEERLKVLEQQVQELSRERE